MFAWMMHLRLHCPCGWQFVVACCGVLKVGGPQPGRESHEKAHEFLGPRIGGSAVESNSCFPAFGHMVHWGVLRNMIEVNFSIRKDGEQKWHGPLKRTYMSQRCNYWSRTDFHTCLVVLCVRAHVLRAPVWMHVTLCVSPREPTGVVTLPQDGDLVFAIGAILKGMPTVRQR